MPPRPWRAWLATRRKLFRVSRIATRLAGPRYRRHRRRIEIDVTWACNMSCYNCNRSCEQAPTNERMTLEQIRRFVAESVAGGIRWERIRLVGGEPTLHPDLPEILAALRTYRDEHSRDTQLEIATNGHGPRVRGVLARLPPDVVVIDTAKESPVQPHFKSFNVAPQDLRAYRRADFRNGCWIIERCGFGLGPYGYYPCAVAAGIDRVAGFDAGRKTLPSDSDDMDDLLARFCRLCGHFKQQREQTIDGPRTSPSWDALYRTYRERRPALTRY
jgi:hypothetical protein